MSGKEKGTEHGVRLPYASDKAVQLLQTFQMRDDDVVVVCYPRSGTNWLKEIVSCILLGGDTDKARALHLQQRIPYLEAYAGDAEAYLQELDKLPSPRALSSHLKLHLLPPDLQQGKCKVLMMLRNPKDVYVSQYCMYHTWDPPLGPDVPWEDAIKDYTHGPALPYGRWVDYVTEWWDARDKIPIKFVKYEDCHQDMGSLITEVAGFLGRDINDEAIEKIKAHCDFNYMKTNPNADPLALLDISHAKSNYMRKGKVGDWKNHFTAAQSEEFDRVYHEEMDRTGIKMQFEL